MSIAIPRSSIARTASVKPQVVQVVAHARQGLRALIAKPGFGLLRLTFLVVTLGAVAMPATGAGYYRWTDENGVQHFTDKPPSSANAERVQAGSRPPPMLLQDQADQAASSASAQAAQVAADAAVAAQKDETRCQQERERLAVLQENQDIRMRDDEGNLRSLSSAEIQAEIEHSREAIEYFCP